MSTCLYTLLCIICSVASCRRCSCGAKRNRHITTESIAHLFSSTRLYSTLHSALYSLLSVLCSRLLIRRIIREGLVSIARAITLPPKYLSQSTIVSHDIYDCSSPLGEIRRICWDSAVPLTSIPHYSTLFKQLSVLIVLWNIFMYLRYSFNPKKKKKNKPDKNLRRYKNYIENSRV